MDVIAALAPLSAFGCLGRFARRVRFGRPPVEPRAAARRPALRRLQSMPTPGESLADAEPPEGCGWFDSSWSLRQGLLVTEHEALSPLPGDPR